ncbi:hypothetical protein BDN72DRAFT_895410 [Pluteus cervinus]|uniref:Uncharacterized protein n=1 Tax=Pluteus cervinus TaxID=181527 RepID=A0ACD3B1Q0_9AGAR|nr:hypothetical protein BDN72DRAFT_895410 [Pluteus cervinus]
MHLFAVLFFALTLVCTLALPVSDVDWKYSVGWNGVTSDLSVLGVLVTPDGSPDNKGTPGGVYFCTDINWKGSCAYTLLPLNQCVTIETFLQDKISSVGPDPGADCAAWSNTSCDGTPSWGFNYPGDPTGGLQTDNPWNDRVKSIQCVAT